jgi:hypothetical protein
VTAVEVAAQRGQFLLEARFHQPGIESFKGDGSCDALDNNAAWFGSLPHAALASLQRRLAVAPAFETYSPDIGRL